MLILEGCTMSRLALHRELQEFADAVYFQPPSNIRMNYPCIVYHKISKYKEFGNDEVYIKKQGYQLTVMDKDPDSLIADDLEDHFQYCSISQYFTNDSIYHVTLELYY